jgi:hypothetical protein
VKVKAHILYSDLFFPEKPIIYETMWKIIVDPDRPQMTNGACALRAG